MKISKNFKILFLIWSVYILYLLVQYNNDLKKPISSLLYLCVTQYLETYYGYIGVDN